MILGLFTEGSRVDQSLDGLRDGGIRVELRGEPIKCIHSN